MGLSIARSALRCLYAGPKLLYNVNNHAEEMTCHRESLEGPMARTVRFEAEMRDGVGPSVVVMNA